VPRPSDVVQEVSESGTQALVGRVSDIFFINVKFDRTQARSCFQSFARKETLFGRQDGAIDHMVL